MNHDNYTAAILLPRQSPRCGLMWGLALSALMFASATSAQSIDPLAAAQKGFDHPVKYAIYSTAWHLSTNAGLRVVAQNQSNEAIELRSIVFNNETGDGNDIELPLNMVVSAGKWAELQLPYLDLLSGNECVTRTMQNDWKLVEISNYTLNPSVRGLIIENTRSFRIYQCVRSVQTTWVYADAAQEGHGNEEQIDRQWLMYHFERLPLD